MAEDKNGGGSEGGYFGRLVFALLATVLTIFIVQSSFSLIVPDIGRVGEAPTTFFRDFGASLGRIQFPELPGPPGVPDYLRDLFAQPTAPTGPTTLPPTTTPPTPPAKKPFPWWILILLLVLGALGGGGYLAYRNRAGLREWLGRGAAPAPEVEIAGEERPEELTIQKIIDEVNQIIKKKIDILQKIEEIVGRKKALIEEQRREYYKAIRLDQAYWADPDAPASRSFKRQSQIIQELIDLEIQLERLLKELMEEEIELTGFKKLPLRQFRVNPFYSKAAKWAYILADYDKTKTKQILEEIKKYETLSPVGLREKFLDFLQRIIGMNARVPDWYVTRFHQIERVIDELIMTYHQWDPASMELIRKDIQLNADGTIKRDSRGRIAWRLRPVIPGGPDATWHISPDDLGVMRGTWYDGPPSICESVMKYISFYFLIGRDESYRQSRWNALINPKEIKKHYDKRERWKAIRQSWGIIEEHEIPDIMALSFLEEEIFFNTRLKPVVIRQLKHLHLLIRHLRYLLSDRVETELQELTVEYYDATGEKQSYSGSQTRDPAFAIPVILRDKLIRIYALVHTGKGPFKFGVYVSEVVATPPGVPSRQRYLSKKVKEATIKTEIRPTLECTSAEFTSPISGGVDALSPPPAGPYGATPYGYTLYGPYAGAPRPVKEYIVSFYLISTEFVNQLKEDKARKIETPIPLKWRDLKSIVIRVGPPVGAPYGRYAPYAPPYASPYGPPYGAPPYGAPYTSPYGPPYGAPYTPPYGAPYAPPYGHPEYGPGYAPPGLGPSAPPYTAPPPYGTITTSPHSGLYNLNSINVANRIRVFKAIKKLISNNARDLNKLVSFLSVNRNKLTKTGFNHP